LISGGTQKTHYAISANYFNQRGIIKNKGFTRFSGRVNIESQVPEKFKTGVNLIGMLMILWWTLNGKTISRQ